MLFYLFSAYALKQHILLPCFLCFLHYLSVTVTRSWVEGGPDWRDGDNRVPLVGSFFPNISQCKCGSRKLQVQQHLETSSPPMNPDLYTQTPGPRHLSFLLYAFLIFSHSLSFFLSPFALTTWPTPTTWPKRKGWIMTFGPYNELTLLFWNCWVLVTTYCFLSPSIAWGHSLKPCFREVTAFWVLNSGCISMQFYPYTTYVFQALVPHFIYSFNSTFLSILFLLFSPSTVPHLRI